MILVTGATGFIGEQLVRTLAAQGRPVRVLARSPVRARALFGPLTEAIDIAEGDLEAPAGLAEAVRGVSQVYHCAARVSFQGGWDAFYRLNVAGTAHLLNACLSAGVQRVVHMSSVAAGGPAVAQPEGTRRARTEADPPQPLPGCPYGASKLAQEQAALAFNERGLHVVVVRPSAVFGPGDPTGINTLLRMVQHGRMPFYLGSRHGQVNVVFVRDVVNGAIAAMERGRPGEVYNLVGPDMTHEQLLNLLARISGGKAPRRTLPEPLLVGAAALVAAIGGLLRLRKIPVTPNDVRNWTAQWQISGEKARLELGLAPTDSAAAWRETLTWLGEQAAGDSSAATNFRHG